MADFADMEWRITGYDSTTKIFERTIPQAQASADAIRRILALLVARNLNPDELVDSVLSGGPLLEVQEDSSHGNRFTLWCGTNPYYVAGLFRKDEKFA